MDWQTIFNIAIPVATAVVGWFVRVLWEADKELREDLSNLREKLPEHYVSKDDFRSGLNDLKNMLERVLNRQDAIFAVLEMKQDKNK